jgi:hypothetical protein
MLGKQCIRHPRQGSACAPQGLGFRRCDLPAERTAERSAQDLSVRGGQTRCTAPVGRRSAKAWAKAFSAEQAASRGDDASILQHGRPSTVRAQGAGQDGGTARGRWNSGRADERHKRMRSRAVARGMECAAASQNTHRMSGKRGASASRRRRGAARWQIRTRLVRAGPARSDSGPSESGCPSPSPMKRPAPGSGS